jgi:catechol 2,3-dioxygenase-like lactoylglutathione lyase family enzyme
MSAPVLDKMCPFFIVSHVGRTIAFYRDNLGFECWHQQPETDPFFATIGRDGAMLFIKAGVAPPVPNSKRDPEMRWDAYVSVQEPDALAADFANRGTTLSKSLQDTHDGLRGFEITDPDGYVLFFGRPTQLLSSKPI